MFQGNKKEKQYDLIRFVWHHFGRRDEGGIGSRKDLSK